MNINMRLLKDTIIQLTNKPLPRITAKIKCSFVAHSIKLCISFAIALCLVVLNSVPSYGAELMTSSAIRTRSLSSVLRSSSTSLSWHTNYSNLDSLTVDTVSVLSVFVQPNDYYPTPKFVPCYLTSVVSGEERVYLYVFSHPSYVGYESSEYPSVIRMGISSYDFDQSYSYNNFTYFGYSRLLGSSSDVGLNSSLPVYSSSSDMESAVGAFISSASASVHWTNGSVATPLFASATPTFTVSSSVSDPAYVLVGSLGYNGTNSICIVASTSSYVNPSSTCDLSDGRSLTFSFERDYGGYHFYFRLPSFNGDLGLNPDFPYFESQDAAFAAFADFLDSQIPTSSYSLPNGNVLYIDIGSGNDFFLNLETTMPDTSAILGYPWADSQYIFWSDTLPSNTSFSASDGTYITWRKSTTDRNILGQTKTAVSELSGIASSRYLVIVNPLIYAQSTNKFNGSVKVSSIPSGTTIYSYPLNAYLSDGVYVNDVSSNGGTGTAVSTGGNINTVSLDDSTVDYSAPSGGLNWQESSQSIAEDVRGLKESLSEFFNNVLTLLGKPVGYIQQLIGAGSSFMQHISGLWSWLPSDVSSVLTSSLIVMVGVAVFKVFL